MQPDTLYHLMIVTHREYEERIRERQLAREARRARRAARVPHATAARWWSRRVRPAERTAPTAA